MSLQYRPWWKRFRVIKMSLIFRWWLSFVNRTHTSLEYTSFNRPWRIMRHGSPSALSKVSGAPSWKTYVLAYYGQLLRRDRILLAVTPERASVETRFITQRVKIFQELYANWWLARTIRTTHNACKWVFKLQIVAHDHPVTYLTLFIYSRKERTCCSWAAFAYKGTFCTFYLRAQWKYVSSNHHF